MISVQNHQQQLNGNKSVSRIEHCEYAKAAGKLVQSKNNQFFI